ncbi:hypothetical protein SAMN05660649_05085 [Desulfotomaculum arcticum]|uniref:Uncharacterized protein n=1 Tax=Desulfotruncus arcticus DSM 17038 TaxID=1121424 RepID=A0A1I2ZRZ7_9FIRM|nr:hypothetical protein [Desulfotruncus arcticus]SFH40376.1 hypothetical protein SAMN05660649_05085 [Desulfotomaculum arcticum] [Desulfotruncus arcticus DSM 17038]
MSIRKIPVAVRAHTETIEKIEKPKFPHKPDLRIPYGKRILVLDTETTTDIYMNLRYGQAIIIEGENMVHEDGIITDHIIFYGDNLTPEEIKIMELWAKDKKGEIMPVSEFVKKIFIPELAEIGTICVGFNLSFDLPRLAIDVKTRTRGKYKDKFELILDQNKYTPSILLEPLDSKKAFISLNFPTLPKKQKDRKHQRQGRLLDLRTLVFALTNESHSLNSACRLYGTKHNKTQADEAGFTVITRENLDYNFNDVVCTAELYQAVMTEYYKHPIAVILPAGKAFSPATIGKAYYKVMNIKPLKDKQPDFPKDILGFAMASYYGGRAEGHYRNQPIKVFHTDVLSMYPSVFTLQNLWAYVIAEGFDILESTEEIKDYLKNICFEDLFRQEIWLSIPALVQIKPDKDLLPVRAAYGEHYQIGLNYLSSDKAMWYTLADILACKILTGKTPEVIRAIRILPQRPQKDLQKVNLRGTIEVDPATDNFFKKVIELRKEFKKQVKATGDEFDSLQMFLKILANSTSYGVYVQLQREETDDNLEINIYGVDSFIHEGKDYEKPGPYYNPIIATMITGAARLVLAMIQKAIIEEGGNYAFCDTDSMSIIDLNNDKPEEIGQRVVQKFKSLNPYNFPGSLLEAEDYNWERKDWSKLTDKRNINSGQYYPLYCYCVSSKRYVLYNLVPDGHGGTNIIIRKQSFHGMGHLLPPEGMSMDNMMAEVWKIFICQEHSFALKKPAFLKNVAMARQTVSKPSILNMFNRQKGLPYEKLIKPGNFFLIGYSANQIFSGSESISKFYCQKYHAIANNHCNNKNECEYKENCLANVHIIAITPYDRVKPWEQLTWFEKNTKEILKVKANQFNEEKTLLKYWCPKDTIIKEGVCQEKVSCNNINCSRGSAIERNAPEPGVTYLKTYNDFIENYNHHPETKFDDSTGKTCGKVTKGLLSPCYVIAAPAEGKKALLHIGKETNTIGTVEDLDTLPEENIIDKEIIQYEPKRTKKTSIDIKQWEQLRDILKEKARPREVWASKIKVTTKYLQKMLAGKYNPSPDLYSLILEICQAEGIKIPSGKIALPVKFEESNKGYIYNLQAIAGSLGNTAEEGREIFKDYCFMLYGLEYVDISTEYCKGIIEAKQQKLQKEQQDHKVQKISCLKLIGEKFNRDTRTIDQFTLSIDDISKYRTRKKSGKRNNNIQVMLKNEAIYNVLLKDNPMVFKLGLLPRPNSIKVNKYNKFEHSGITWYFSEWFNYESLPWISWLKFRGNYKINLKEFQADISNDKFPASDLNKDGGGKVYINPLTAWRIYGKKDNQVI